MLPASVADEQLADILRALPENPGMYEKIVDALFAVPDAGAALMSAPTEHGQQIGLDPQLASSIVSSDSMTAAGIPVLTNPCVMLSMFRAVEKICETHGFVPMQSRLVRFMWTSLYLLTICLSRRTIIMFCICECVRKC